MNLTKKQQRAIVMDYALACANQTPEDQMLGRLMGTLDRPGRNLQDWSMAEVKQLNRKVKAFIERHDFKCEELTPALAIHVRWYGEEQVMKWYDPETVEAA